MSIVSSPGDPVHGSGDGARLRRRSARTYFRTGLATVGHGTVRSFSLKEFHDMRLQPFSVSFLASLEFRQSRHGESWRVIICRNNGSWVRTVPIPWLPQKCIMLGLVGMGETQVARPTPW